MCLCDYATVHLPLTPIPTANTNTPTELCGFILTTQRPVYHAAEETIRNGPYVDMSVIGVVVLLTP